jgi:hypothetical protein
MNSLVGIQPPRRQERQEDENMILIPFRSSGFLGVLAVDRPDFQAAHCFATPVASHRGHPVDQGS